MEAKDSGASAQQIYAASAQFWAAGVSQIEEAPELQEIEHQRTGREWRMRVDFRVIGGSERKTSVASDSRADPMIEGVCAASRLDGLPYKVKTA